MRVPVELQYLEPADIDPLQHRLSLDGTVEKEFNNIKDEKMHLPNVLHLVQEMFTPF